MTELTHHYHCLPQIYPYLSARPYSRCTALFSSLLQNLLLHKNIRSPIGVDPNITSLTREIHFELAWTIFLLGIAQVCLALCVGNICTWSFHTPMRIIVIPIAPQSCISSSITLLINSLIITAL
jgi:hypothetical protein